MKTDRERIIEALNGRLTANDDHLIDRVTAVVITARADQAAKDAEIARNEWAVTKIGAVSIEHQAEYERNAIANAILATSPDPDYAERVRAEQRKVDAKICDVIATENSRGTFNDCSREVRAVESCAAAIRRAGEGRE